MPKLANGISKVYVSDRNPMKNREWEPSSRILAEFCHPRLSGLGFWQSEPAMASSRSPAPDMGRHVGAAKEVLGGSYGDSPAFFRCRAQFKPSGLSLWRAA